MVILPLDWTPKLKTFNTMQKPDVSRSFGTGLMAHAFNSSFHEAEAGISLSQRPAIHVKFQDSARDT